MDSTQTPQDPVPQPEQITRTVRFIERAGESWVSTDDLVDLLTKTANLPCNRGILQRACLTIAENIRKASLE